jgi:hypothetical protein
MRLFRKKRLPPPYRRINTDGDFGVPADRKSMQVSLSEAAAKTRDIGNTISRVEAQVSRSRLVYSGTTSEMEDFVPYNSGTMFWDEIEEQLFVWNGSYWLEANSVFSGTTEEREAFTPPVGGVWCDTDYDSLYACMGNWGWFTADRVSPFLEEEGCKALWTMNSLTNMGGVNDMTGGVHVLINVGMNVGITAEGLISYASFDATTPSYMRGELRYDSDATGHYVSDSLLSFDLDYLPRWTSVLICRPYDVRYACLFEKIGGQYGYGPAMFTRSTRQFGFYNDRPFQGGKGVETDIIDEDDWSNKWHILIARYYSEWPNYSVDLLHNGSEYTETGVSFTSNTTQGDLRLGMSLSGSTNSYRFHGDISTLAIYDNYLNDEMVNRLFSRIRHIYNV